MNFLNFSKDLPFIFNDYKQNYRLLLFAEMKVPGRAWLEFEVEKKQKGSTIKQTAIFDPIGLPGVLYWYLVYPLHTFIFKGMLRNIVREVKKLNSKISD